MEIVQYFATVAEFADYTCEILFDELYSLLHALQGQVPQWFFVCASLSVAYALMCKIWR